MSDHGKEKQECECTPSHNRKRVEERNAVEESKCGLDHMQPVSESISY